MDLHPTPPSSDCVHEPPRVYCSAVLDTARDSPCPFADVCRCGTSAPGARGLIRLASTRRRISQGSPLYHAGDRFQCLYVVRAGSFKTTATDGNGQEHVMDFYVPGQTLGVEAIGDARYTSSAFALEDSEVCGIVLNRPSSVYPSELLSLLCNIMSAQILRDQHIKHLLGRSSAEERVARFLLDLSERYAILGNTPNELRLKMSRREIGDFTGMALETVSRAFTLLAELRLIRAVRQNIWILDPAGLRQAAKGELPRLTRTIS